MALVVSDMSQSTDDKNHIAMLAIPVIITMLLGFSSDVLANYPTPLQGGSGAPLEEVRIADEGESKEMGKNPRSQSEGSKVSEVASKKQQLQSAVEKNDYNAFLKAATGMPFGDIMTETAFSELVDQYFSHK